MNKIRVLVVDDAVVVRRMVADLLAEDDAIEVVGTAPNGRIALAKIARLNPDLVTLDLEMPEMDGLNTLTAVRRLYPRLPVLIVSRFARAGAPITLEALALGANDYFAVPEKGGEPPTASECVRDQLIPKIKRFALRAGGRSNPPQPSPVARPASRSSVYLMRPPGGCPGDRLVHRRAECAGRVAARLPGRLPRFHADRPAQAARTSPCAWQSG